MTRRYSSIIIYMQLKFKNIHNKKIIIAAPWCGWHHPAVTGRPRGVLGTRIFGPRNVSSASEVCTRGSSWRTCGGRRTRRKLRPADGALRTLACRRPDTWGSRVWHSPRQAGQSDRRAGPSVSHRTPGDRHQSLRPGTSQSSGRGLGWSECICNIYFHKPVGLTPMVLQSWHNDIMDILIPWSEDWLVLFFVLLLWYSSRVLRRWRSYYKVRSLRILIPMIRLVPC